MPFEVKNAPAVFAHMHIPRTPRLVLSPGPAKSPTTVPQWVSTPASRLKKAHSDVRPVGIFSQTKEELQVYFGKRFLRHRSPYGAIFGGLGT